MPLVRVSNGGSTQYQYVIQRGNPDAVISLDHDTTSIMIFSCRQAAYDRHKIFVDGIQQTLISLGNVGQGYAGWGLYAAMANGNYTSGQVITVKGGDSYSSDLTNYGAVVVA